MVGPWSAYPEPQVVCRPLASWIATPTVRRIRRLELSRERQCLAQALVLDGRPGHYRLDLVEIVGLRQRAVQIFCVRRRPAETLVVVFDKPGQPGIGHLDGGNAGQTQFLDQPVLERAEPALDTALCLRLLAQGMSMFSSVRARPNCVAPSPPAASLAFTRKML